MLIENAQKDFLDLMRNGYVISSAYITALFKVRNTTKFVDQIRDRTGLDIYQGRRFSFENDADEVVYYMISDIKPEAPGLDYMTGVEVYRVTEEVCQPVGFQNGYYLMWDCPKCSQFHKVDLGDEELVGPIHVRCIKCGKRYLINEDSL